MAHRSCSNSRSFTVSSLITMKSCGSRRKKSIIVFFIRLPGPYNSTRAPLEINFSYNVLHTRCLSPTLAPMFLYYPFVYGLRREVTTAKNRFSISLLRICTTILRFSGLDYTLVDTPPPAMRVLLLLLLSHHHPIVSPKRELIRCLRVTWGKSEYNFGASHVKRDCSKNEL